MSFDRARRGQPAKVVAFYAFKGGTGRSFALAHTGWYLARLGHRVVAVDLDLAAPSLWSLLSPGHAPRAGILEYLAPRRGASRPQARDLLEEVPLDPKAKGALYLLQAGRLDSAYLERLQGLDWTTLVSLPSTGHAQLSLFGAPLDDLFGEIQRSLSPDVILVDAPTGYNDTSNLCLRVLADLVIVLFAPTRVHLDGIGRVVASFTANGVASPSRLDAASPRPDVYCVASTILFSRVGGPTIRRIHEAFGYLDRVRHEALGRPATLDVRTEALVHQEPAVISYDERLAGLDHLPTDDEPRQAHFAAFQELLDYVEGALPPPKPRVELTLAAKPPLLTEMQSQFRLFAEQQSSEVQALFLRTSHLAEVQERRVALVLGGKGSGKTALFLFLTAQPDEAVPVHGPGLGLSPDLLCALQDRIPAFDVVWRTYLLSRLPACVATTHDPALSEAVAIIRQLKDRLDSLPRLAELLTTPEAGARLDQAWRGIDADLVQRSARPLRLCLDGLDTAFKADTVRRDRGLVALFTAWQVTFAQLERVEVKTFLRKDLWERLSFPEKSHLRGRELHLTWDEGNLWRLVVKRALSALSFAAWVEKCLPAPVLTAGQAEHAALEQLHPYLDLIFERHIWGGKNSLARNWILRRLQDGRGTTFPRDLICLLSEAMVVEAARIRAQDRVTEDAAISRQSLADALIPTSRQRVEAVQEEYPELAEVLQALRGLEAAGRLDQLRDRLRHLGEREASVALDLIVEAGVVRLQDEGYQVPDLYRHGLDMPRPGPR